MQLIGVGPLVHSFISGPPAPMTGGVGLFPLPETQENCALGVVDSRLRVSNLLARILANDVPGAYDNEFDFALRSALLAKSCPTNGVLFT